MTKVHHMSARLDFSLSLNMASILLMWTAMAFAFHYSYNLKSRWSYCICWILSGAFMVWIVAEVSRNHFVESLFFILALLAAGNILVFNKKVHAGASNE